jgi:c-di-GMP-binding flagellar brake protein YcgR
MTYKKIERRKSARVYLKPDNATALLKKENSTDEIYAKILNVSEGGFGLGIKKGQGVNVSPGDNFVIVDIKGRDELVNEGSLIISVRWVLDYDGMESLGAGCAFTEINDSYKNKILSFLEKNI